MKGGIRGRDFRLIVASTGLSALGDELALIALTIKVADLTDSGPAVAALLVAGLLPMVLLAPVAGYLVDRYETTRTLALSVFFQAGLAVGLAFTTNLPLLLVLAFLLGAGAAISSPAVYTLAPVVVGEDRVTEANSYLESGRYVGMVAGPALAGVLANGPGARAAMLVDAGTFVVIGAAALALRVRRHASQEESEGRQRGHMREGFRFIRHDRVLLLAFTAVGAVILFAAMDNVAEVFFAREALNAGDWGFGLLASGWLLGMVGGAVLIGRTLPTERLVASWMTAAVVGGAAVAMAAAVPVIWFAVAMFVLGGVANGVQSVSARSLLVHRTPDRLRGRVFAAYGGLANGMLLAATASAGLIVAAFGGRVALLVGGIGTVVAGAIGFLWYAALPAEAKRPPVVLPDSGSITVVDESPSASTTEA
ncbi:MAG: MFS transporter [Actinomycetota bacterium]